MNLNLKLLPEGAKPLECFVTRDRVECRDLTGWARSSHDNARGLCK